MSGPTLGIGIEIPVDQALPAIERVKGGLREAQAEGEKLRASLTQSMSGAAGAFASLGSAIEQERSALQRSAQLHQQMTSGNNALAQGFGKVAEQLQREKSMLDEILAPQQQYFDKLTALDKLLDRNAISTQQYVQQVTNLNQAMTKTPQSAAPVGGTGGGLASLGNLGSLLTGGAIGAGVLALGQQVSGLIDEYRHLEDEYTTLVNHEMKFVDGTHTLNEVTTQQLGLSSALHSTMKDSIDVYDSVGDALVDMNQSSQDVVTVTKVLGEEAAISGKSMSSAGEVMNRMTLAMDSGVMAGKALKQALVGYDAISDTLTAHFHTTRAGLVLLVDQHKIGSKDIVEALKAEAAQVQKNFDQRKMTNAEEVAQLNERVNLYRQQGYNESASYALADGSAEFQKFADNVHRARDAQYDQQQAVAEALPTIEQLTKELENQSGAFAKVGNVERDYMGKVIDDTNHAREAIDKLGQTISTALGKDAWAGLDDKTGLLKFLPLGIKTAMDYSAALGANKKQIDDLNAAYAAGAFSTADYLKKLEQLTAGVASQNAAAADLANNGTATLKKYTDAVYEAKRALNDLNAARSGMDQTTYRNQRDSLETTIFGRLPETIKQLEEIQDPQETYNRQVAALDSLLATTQISWGEYEMQLEKVSHAYGVLTENEKTWMELKRDLDPGQAGKDAVEASAKAAADLKEFSKQLTDQLQHDQQAHSEALTKEWHTAIEQTDKAIDGLKANASTVLDPLKQSFVEIVTTGTTSVSAMFKKIESGIVGKIADSAEGGLLDAIFGKTSSQMAGANVAASMATGGTTAGATIAASMTGAGYAVAAAIGSAMAAGGATGGAASGIAAGIIAGAGGAAGGGGGGSALGGLTEGAASGGAAAAARAFGGGGITPSTPAVVAATQAASSPRVVQHFNMMYDRNAIISNRSDDERFLAAVRRHPSAFRAMRNP